MLLTAAQRTMFFEEDAQMGIPNRTVIQLQTEGLSGIEDLVDFDKETIKGIASSLRRPAGRIADPNPGAAAGATIRTPPFAFEAKSQQRLIVSTKLLRFYDTVGHVATAGNLQWTPAVMKNFSEQWLESFGRQERWRRTRCTNDNQGSAYYQVDCSLQGLCTE
jgi:hypothetical protein